MRWSDSSHPSQSSVSSAVEHLTFNQGVDGSKPSRGTILNRSRPEGRRFLSPKGEARYHSPARPGGGTGRRRGLKIPRATVPVRARPRAPGSRRAASAALFLCYAPSLRADAINGRTFLSAGRKFTESSSSTLRKRWSSASRYVGSPRGRARKQTIERWKEG